MLKTSIITAAKETQNLVDRGGLLRKVLVRYQMMMQENTLLMKKQQSS
ncbi:hypothetical protein JOC76_004490 [Neobacillus cucumis]|nr:hypothetical protein [Neobacillus cucumis]MBM7654998.1 hypothetical protein [Neobacillus cucumis]